MESTSELIDMVEQNIEPTQEPKLTKQQRKRRNRKQHEKQNKQTINDANQQIEDMKKTKEDQELKNIKLSLETASEIWAFIKKYVSQHEDYGSLKDQEKIKLISSLNPTYEEFQKTFPIVFRYMVCMGQYSHKAFDQYLKKCKNTPPDPKRRMEKGYQQDEQFKRHADYIKYLWIAYKGRGYNHKDANAIWYHAYKSLKKEFDEFQDNHDDIKKMLDNETAENNKERLGEIISGLTKGDIKLNDDDQQALVELLQQKVIKKRHNTVFKEIAGMAEKLQENEIVLMAKGTAEDTSDRPTIRAVINDTGEDLTPAEIQANIEKVQKEMAYGRT